MRFIQLVTLTAVLTIISNNAWAQSTNTPAPTGQAISIHVGPLLPSSVGATDEILKGGGLRYAYPISSKGLHETGLTASNSVGVRYYDLSTSLRGDIPFADMFAFGLIGLNAVRIMGPASTDPNYYLGGHLGGGILAHVADTLYFRSEMRFNFHPGLILFFGFGLEYRFGSGGGNN